MTTTSADDMLTDRDIAAKVEVKVLAEAKDPGATHVSEVPHGDVVTVNADDDIDRMLETTGVSQVWVRRGRWDRWC